MGEILKKRLKQKKFESTEQEALLNIFVTSNHQIFQFLAVNYHSPTNRTSGSNRT